MAQLDNIIMQVDTVRGDGMGLSPRKVYDRFLDRIQIRVMTDNEFFALCGDFVELNESQTGQKPNLIFCGIFATPFYGSEKWRGKQ